MDATSDDGLQAARSLLGTRLEHYELLDAIGSGGMGRVFRGRDTRLDRLVAIKILSPHLNDDPDLCRRFEQEAKAAARLGHPAFAAVHHYGVDHGLRFIAMEFVDGENLKERIAKAGRLPAADVASICLQIARGLIHASAAGVVHRDIKPSNIIVRDDGAARLVDMGLARTLLSDANELTSAGATLGTFDYIAPEQARDPRSADTRADIYSLGCTAYHALAGRPPFGEGTALQKLLAHQGDAVGDVRQFAPETPAELVLVVARMLAKNPADRYQTPAELVADLQWLVDPDAAAGPPSDVRLAERRPLLERHAGWLGPTLLLAVVWTATTLLAEWTRPKAAADNVGPARFADRGAPTQADGADRSVGPKSDAPAPADVAAIDPAQPSPANGGGNGRPGLMEPAAARTDAVATSAELDAVLRRYRKGQTIRLTGSRYVLKAERGRPFVIDRDLLIESTSRSPAIIDVDAADLQLAADDELHPADVFVVRGDASFELRRVCLRLPGDVMPRVESLACVGVRFGRLRLLDSMMCADMPGEAPAAAFIAVRMQPGMAEKASTRLEATALAGFATGVQLDARLGDVRLEAVDTAWLQVVEPTIGLGQGRTSLRLDRCLVAGPFPQFLKAADLAFLEVGASRTVFASTLATGRASVVQLAGHAAPMPAAIWCRLDENVYAGFADPRIDGLGLGGEPGLSEERYGIAEQSPRIETISSSWLDDVARLAMMGSLSPAKLNEIVEGSPVVHGAAAIGDAGVSRPLAGASLPTAGPEARPAGLRGLLRESAADQRSGDRRPPPAASAVSGSPTSEAAVGGAAADDRSTGRRQDDLPLEQLLRRREATGTIRLPAGTETIDQPLVIASRSVEIVGEGASQTKLSLTLPAALATQEQAFVTIPDGAVLRIRGVTIEVRGRRDESVELAAASLFRLKGDAKVELVDCFVEIGRDWAACDGALVDVPGEAHGDGRGRSMVIDRCDVRCRGPLIRLTGDGPFTATVRQSQVSTLRNVMSRVGDPAWPAAVVVCSNSTIYAAREAFDIRLEGASMVDDESPALKIQSQATAWLGEGAAPFCRVAGRFPVDPSPKVVDREGDGNGYVGFDHGLQMTPMAGGRTKSWPVADWLAETDAPSDEAIAGNPPVEMHPGSIWTLTTFKPTLTALQAGTMGRTPLGADPAKLPRR